MKIKEIIELLIEKQTEIDRVVDGSHEMDVENDAWLRHATGFHTNSQVLEYTTSLRADSGLITEAIALLSGIDYTETRGGHE